MSKREQKGFYLKDEFKVSTFFVVNIAHPKCIKSVVVKGFWGHKLLNLDTFLVSYISLISTYLIKIIEALTCCVIRLRGHDPLCKVAK